MNIVQINYADLIGRIFNGYDLMEALNKKGYNVWQIVKNKQSSNNKVIEAGYDWAVHEGIRNLEYKYGVENVLFPYAKKIMSLEAVQKADIIHLHILHNGFVSLFDYPEFFYNKKTVWTIHDPWILTGGCIHPLNCKGWTEVCKQCDELPKNIYKTDKIRVSDMQSVKRDMWKKIRPEIIVSSSFMEEYIKKSPLTAHITNVYKIPFGVDYSDYANKDWIEEKRKRILSEEKIRIGFRISNDEIKGCKYIFEALRKYNLKERVKLIAVGKGEIPNDIFERYEVKNMGWLNEKEMIDFWKNIDIFLMPSLAETFGLMAIESMATYNPVICFKNTEVAKIVDAPKIGAAVDYGSSTALGEAILRLIDNPSVIIEKSLASGKLADTKYKFDDYVTRHERLYEELCGKR